MAKQHKFYRQIMHVEILTCDEPVEQYTDPNDLDTIRYDVTEGDACCKITWDETEEVSQEQMGRMVSAQGNEPTFLDFLQ